MIQGYLAHKKTPPPWDHLRALGIGLLKGPMWRRFLESELPLFRDQGVGWRIEGGEFWAGRGSRVWGLGFRVPWFVVRGSGLAGLIVGWHPGAETHPGGPMGRRFLMSKAPLLAGLTVGWHWGAETHPGAPESGSVCCSLV